MKATYNNCKTLIEANRYAYQDMMDKLALFLLVNLIGQEDFVELTGMMAAPEPEPPVEKMPTE